MAEDRSAGPARRAARREGAWEEPAGRPATGPASRATDGKLLAVRALRPVTPSVTLACLSRRRPPCRSHLSRSRARARVLSTQPDPAAGAAVPTSSYRGGGERVSWTRTAVRHVFHIVSTGEPALAVRAGHLRRGPRLRTAGARGSRFPKEQGNGLRRVIHNLSRTPAANRPIWALVLPKFSTGRDPARFPSDPAEAPARWPPPASGGRGNEPRAARYPQASMPGS
jgi:hypothetical protein